MTTATNRRTVVHGSAARWTWAAVVALVAALAVLVHHDTSATAVRAPVMSAMPGMDHTSAAMTPTAASAGHGTALGAEDPATGGDAACSGPAMQHCSSGDPGTTQLAPPPATPHVDRGDTSYGVLAGHDLPGVPNRAPPDLSVLSRLLI
ncbi:hypothetical protein SMIR_41580 (plasmid) [Streptomyces mirabilis]|uniref:hypothetical protein n=1 Tax=Streptomyces mirabilis TaxID=68239 RepID=UPI001BB0046F|nr:hypothetical protein [Streptomyces mirabilis]QUW85549.1 hypothetical protein SMIR_41580 [Streptomyces mirabilis]